MTKHLMTGPAGNSAFCFHSTLNVGLREIKLVVSFFLNRITSLPRIANDIISWNYNRSHLNTFVF